MPTQVDDLDDLLRQAMKSLDDQVPSGYFDAGPDQVLARLEGNMQSTGQGTSEREQGAVAPPPAAPQAAATNEDSGLHDIRNLAQSTKQRLSSRRISSSSLRASDDDIIAASSAGWKAVALPEPAKMVSLPSIDELPSKAEIRALEKAAAAPAVAAVDAPAKAAVARPAAPAQSKSRRVLAIASLGVAAAAGFAIFVATRPGEKSEAPAVMSSGSAAQAAAPAPERPQVTATPIAEPAPAPAPPPAGPAPIVENIKEPSKPAMVMHAPPKAPPPLSKKALRGIDSVIAADTPEKTKATKDGAGGGKDKGKEQDSFDDLLKQAGADTQPKVVKPKLANKDLSSDDFKRGMSAIEGNLKGCYKSTQGIARLQIKIAPSGAVSGVTVQGQFAGKPEAACLISAARSASFPPWDGSPQSYTYPIMLSE